jgi:hypothetical protein
MRGRFPATRFADALCALVVLAVIASGSFAIALGTLRTVVAFNMGSDLALTYRPGDNPWTYAAWSSARDLGVPESSSNYAANAAHQLTVIGSDDDGKSFSVLAQATVPRNGAEGMIITQGGFAGGWAFYIDHGRPVLEEYDLDGIERYTIAADRPLAPGPQTLRFSVHFDATDAGEDGVATLTANGEEIARGRIERTLSPSFFAE